MWFKASRKWHQKIVSFLQGIGYTRVQSDPTLFTHKTSSSFTSLLIYVDDIVLIGDKLEELQVVKTNSKMLLGSKTLELLNSSSDWKLLPHNKASLYVKDNTSSISIYKTTYKRMVVLKYKTHYKLLYAFITLFLNIPLINVV